MRRPEDAHRDNQFPSARRLHHDLPDLATDAARRATTRATHRGQEPGITIGWHTGDRAALLPLFELAEDSPSELNHYLDLGRILLASSDGEPVGHLQLVDTDRAGHAELKNMAVRTEMQGLGIGRRLVQSARAVLAAEGVTTLTVATATADIANLRFYQRQGFRMCRIERDVFTEASGYPRPSDVDGIPLRDRVWLDLPLHRPQPGVEPATTTTTTEIAP